MLHSLHWKTHPKTNGTPGGIRTRDLPLRRRLLYPTELQARMEQVMGIEPTSPAWKAGALAVVLHLQIRQENVSLEMIAQAAGSVKQNQENS